MSSKDAPGLLSGLPFGPALSRLYWYAGRALHRAGERTADHPWVAERVRFVRAWRANPKRIGAVWPSSRQLARAITCELDATSGPLIELGAGTGAFTRVMLARGLDPRELVLVETDAAFAAQLQRDFPGAQVHRIDACKLDRVTLFPDQLAGAAICGLPLLNMPVRHQIGILRGTFSQLRADGALYLFTYGPRCPVPQRILDRLGLRARHRETVLVNLPPAHVWKLTRRAAL